MFNDDHKGHIEVGKGRKVRGTEGDRRGITMEYISRGAHNDARYISNMP